MLSKLRTVQFQMSPTLRFPLPRLVIMLFWYLGNPVVLPVMFSTPFLNHHHCTARVVFSKSPGVALQSRVEEEFGDNGVIVGTVMLGGVLPVIIFTVTLARLL